MDDMTLTGRKFELRTALQTLLCDADLRLHLGEAGRARVLQHYAQQDVARRNLALYAEVVAR